MKKQLLFMTMAAVAALSSCSTDEAPETSVDVPVGMSEVPIRLSTGVPGTRASIESDDNGLFEVDGLGIYALARTVMQVNPAPLPISWAGDAPGTKTYGVLLENLEANAVKNEQGTLTNIEFADGQTYYYPMGNWYTYGFYGYYPRTENIEATATSRVANITITGKEDVIYGKAVSDEAYAYSARYFRQEGNRDKVPAMQFDHKLMRITFSAVPAPDVEGGDTYVSALNMKVQSVKVLRVPVNGKLVIADYTNPENDGKLTFDWEDTLAMQDLTLLDANDQPLNSDNYYMEVVNNDTVVEKTIGQGILLPVPEQGSNYKYRVAVTLADREGNVYECEYPQELELSEGASFQPGKSYNVRMTINGPKVVSMTANLTQWTDGDGTLTGIEF